MYAQLAAATLSLDYAHGTINVSKLLILYIWNDQTTVGSNRPAPDMEAPSIDYAGGMIDRLLQPIGIMGQPPDFTSHALDFTLEPLEPSTLPMDHAGETLVNL
ncbi:hypothetical protein [Sporosarcina sp. USHLN248]|uniref:hypothetical protein n=1 Tax=Sporosarcina sp. USHLN248 TaxID=3081300 RepID=UPI00301B529E